MRNKRKLRFKLICQILAENNKNYREELGFTQHSLAKKTKLSRSTIARVEAGKYDIDFKTVKALAKAFAIDEWLMVSR